MKTLLKYLIIDSTVVLMVLVFRYILKILIKEVFLR